MSGNGMRPEGRLIGLMLPVGIVFLALVVSHAMDLGEHVAQHKRLQANLTVVRQQVVVGQSKNRRLAEVGKGILDLAPTNQFAAAIQQRFRIRPTGSRGEPAAVYSPGGGETNAPPPAVAATAPALPAATLGMTLPAAGATPLPAVDTTLPQTPQPLAQTNAPARGPYSLQPRLPAAPLAPRPPGK